MDNLANESQKSEADVQSKLKDFEKKLDEIESINLNITQQHVPKLEIVSKKVDWAVENIERLGSDIQNLDRKVNQLPDAQQEMKREQKMMIENNIIFQEISKSFIQEKEHLKKINFLIHLNIKTN
jgi:hypothetical protein